MATMIWRRMADRRVELGPSTTSQLSEDLSLSRAGWSTDFNRHEVPLDEFPSGGPGKDRIPNIDLPQFQRIGDIDWLKDPEPVIAFGNWIRFPTTNHFWFAWAIFRPETTIWQP